MSSNSRERVLEAAWRLASEEGIAQVTMATIARAGGVSRQMVYLHFGSRAGLLTAMARHHDERSGFVRRVQEAGELAPAEGLEALLRAWLEYVPQILSVARALQAAALAGAEGGEAWHDRMAALRATFRHAMDGVELRDGWTADRAADWLWARAHPSAWDQLVNECGWEPAEFVERTVATTLAEIRSA